MNIIPIIVIYNKDISDSVVLKLIESEKLFENVIICDNSTKENNNEKIAIEKGWIYLSQGKNIGLSKAYNLAIDTIIQRNIKCDYLFMLDDDADLSSAYVRTAMEYLTDQNDILVVPIIKVHNMIMSPSKCGKFGRVKRVKSIKEITPSNITAINNGMFIGMEIVRKLRYNENLFLDYVDHDFIKSVKKNKFDIIVMNIEINHNMSINDNSIAKESRLFRFKLYSRDLKEFYKNNFMEKCYYLIHITIMKLKYCLQYKTLEFLKK